MSSRNIFKASMTKKAAALCLFLLLLTLTAAMALMATPRITGAFDTNFYTAILLNIREEGFGNTAILAEEVIDRDADGTWNISTVIYQARQSEHDYIQALPSVLNISIFAGGIINPFTHHIIYNAEEHQIPAGGELSIAPSGSLIRFELNTRNVGGLVVQRTNVTIGLVLIDQDEFFAGGEGTNQNPFIVETPRHLDNMRFFMNSYFELAGDIDLDGFRPNANEFDRNPSVDTRFNWRGIGLNDPRYSFEGNIDGGGYAVKNLSLDNDGFFRRLNGGTIRNLRFEDAALRATDVATGILAQVAADPVLYNVGASGVITYRRTVAGLIYTASFSEQPQNAAAVIDGENNFDFTFILDAAAPHAIGGVFRNVSGVRNTAVGYDTRPILRGINIEVTGPAHFNVGSGVFANAPTNLRLDNIAATAHNILMHNANGGFASRLFHTDLGDNFALDIKVRPSGNINPQTFGGLAYGISHDSTMIIGDDADIKVDIELPVSTGHYIGGLLGNFGDGNHGASMTIGDRFSFDSRVVVGNTLRVGGFIAQTWGTGGSGGFHITIGDDADFNIREVSSLTGEIAGLIGFHTTTDLHFGDRANITVGSVRGTTNVGGLTSGFNSSMTFGDDLYLNVGRVESTGATGGIAPTLGAAGQTVSFGARADMRFGEIIGGAGAVNVGGIAGTITAGHFAFGADSRLTAGRVVGGGSSGAVAGALNFNGTLENLTVYDSTIIGAANTGGVIGNFAAGTGTAVRSVNNVSVKNVTVTGTGNNIGGVVGNFAAGDNTNIQNVLAENVSVSGTGANIGGVVGNFIGGANALISDISASNINVLSTTAAVTSAVGGIAGNFGAGNFSVIADVSISDSDIIGATANIGGITGTFTGGTNAFIEDIDVFNVTVRGGTQYIGGVAGFLTNTDVRRASVLAYVEGGSVPLNDTTAGIGGIAGVFNNTTAGRVIADVTINSGTVLKGPTAGGIAGNTHTANAPLIQNATIQRGVTIDSDGGARAGGIFGRFTNATIRDSRILGLTIVNNSMEAGGFVGFNPGTITTDGVNSINAHITGGTRLGGMFGHINAGGGAAFGGGTNTVDIFIDGVSEIGGFIGRFQNNVRPPLNGINIVNAELHASAAAAVNIGGLIGMHIGAAVPIVNNDTTVNSDIYWGGIEAARGAAGVRHIIGSLNVVQHPAVAHPDVNGTFNVTIHDGAGTPPVTPPILSGDIVYDAAAGTVSLNHTGALEYAYQVNNGAVNISFTAPQNILVRPGYSVRFFADNHTYLFIVPGVREGDGTITLFTAPYRVRFDYTGTVVSEFFWQINGGTINPYFITNFVPLNPGDTIMFFAGEQRFSFTLPAPAQPPQLFVDTGAYVPGEWTNEVVDFILSDNTNDSRFTHWVEIDGGVFVPATPANLRVAVSTPFEGVVFRFQLRDPSGATVYTTGIFTVRIDRSTPILVLTPTTTAFAEEAGINLMMATLAVPATAAVPPSQIVSVTKQLGNGVPAIIPLGGINTAGTLTIPNITANGLYTIRVTDGSGRIFTQFINITNIRVLPVDGFVIIDPTNGEGFHRSIDFILPYANDIRSVQVSRNNGPWLAVTSYPVFTALQNGDYIVRINFNDGFAVQSAVLSVRNIDTAVPVIQLIYSNDGWVTTDAFIDVRITNIGGSGLAELNVFLNGVLIDTVDVSGVAGTFNMPFEVTQYGRGRGRYTFEVLTSTGIWVHESISVLNIELNTEVTLLVEDISGNTGGWTASPVALQLRAFGNNGMIQSALTYYMSRDNGLTWQVVPPHVIFTDNINANLIFRVVTETGLSAYTAVPVLVMVDRTADIRVLAEWVNPGVLPPVDGTATFRIWSETVLSGYTVWWRETSGSAYTEITDRDGRYFIKTFGITDVRQYITFKLVSHLGNDAFFNVIIEPDEVAPLLSISTVQDFTDGVWMEELTFVLSLANAPVSGVTFYYSVFAHGGSGYGDWVRLPGNTLTLTNARGLYRFRALTGAGFEDIEHFGFEVMVDSTVEMRLMVRNAAGEFETIYPNNDSAWPAWYTALEVFVWIDTFSSRTENGGLPVSVFADPFLAIGANRIVTINQNGVYTFTVTNAAGVTRSFVYNITRIDTAVPMFTVSGMNAVTTGTPPVVEFVEFIFVLNSVGRSGFDTYQYRIGDGAWTNITNLFSDSPSIHRWMITDTLAATMTFRAVSNSGAVSEVSLPFSFNIDASTPAVSVSGTLPTVQTTDNVTILLTVDWHSAANIDMGGVTVTYGADRVASLMLSPLSSPGDIVQTWILVMESNGTVVVTATGNNNRFDTATVTLTDIIDSIIPTFTVMSSTASTSGAAWTNGPVTFYFPLTTPAPGNISGVTFWFSAYGDITSAADNRLIPYTDTSFTAPAHSGRFFFYAVTGAGAISAASVPWYVNIDMGVPEFTDITGNNPAAFTNQNIVVTFTVAFTGATGSVSFVGGGNIVNLATVSEDGLTRTLRYTFASNYSFTVRITNPNGEHADLLLTANGRIHRDAPVISGTVSGSEYNQVQLNGRSFRTGVTLSVAASADIDRIEVRDADGNLVNADFDGGTHALSRNGTFTVTVVDVAGNTSQVTFTIARLPIAIIIISCVLGVAAVSVILLLVFINIRNKKAIKALISASTASDDPNKFLMFKRIK